MAAAADLLATGATVPFIARYRKEATGSLDEVSVAAVRDRLGRLAELDKRREAVLRSLTERELLTEDLRAALEGAGTLSEVEDLYLPFRPKRRTRATIARERGLEPLARRLFAQDTVAGPSAEEATSQVPDAIPTAASVPGTATAGPTSSPDSLPTRPTATPVVNPNVYLKNGASGSDVRRMQQRLIELGYLSGTATGRFNDVTEQAVYAFQRRNVSYADGIAGPLTLEKLYSSSARSTSSSAGVIGMTLERGVRDSAAVRTMQQRLKELRFYTGAVDGDFGISTETAVKEFQAANNLRVDGRAGESTLNRLFSSDANGPGSVTPTPRPPSAGTPTPIPFYVDVTPNPQGGYVTLREGNSGALVRNLQQALKDQGYFNLTVDGLYGVGTSESVREFQRRKGLSQDGVAGPATQRILFEGNYPSGS